MKLLSILLVASMLASCITPRVALTQAPFPSTPQDTFWNALRQLCGKAYEGAVAAAPANDTAFLNKRLVMHVSNCGDSVIRIPFSVGGNRSRTWVLTRTNNRILLKHDHRHEDGTPDAVTGYGGWTPNSGTATLQLFPADSETATLLPAAANNVWWIELVPGSHFSYNLRRIGSDRWFSIRFDLTRTIETPPAPWGAP